jgi:hypothetical protein
MVVFLMYFKALLQRFRSGKHCKDVNVCLLFAENIVFLADGVVGGKQKKR